MHLPGYAGLVSTLGIHKHIALVRKNEAWCSPCLHYLQGVDPAANQPLIKPSNYLTPDWSPGKT